MKGSGADKRPVVRPADAAGLVILRDRPHDLEVLLGRRHPASRFMPGVFVFPGGRVDPVDARPSGFPEPAPAAPGGLDRDSRVRILAFARTALRETWEETGLLCGVPASGSGVGIPSAPTAAHWQAFAKARFVPDFADLRLVARAITPRGSPIRFHTRFFVGNGERLAGEIRGDGELQAIGWYRLDDLADLPMARVNRFVAAEAAARWRAGRWSAPAALLRYRAGRRIVRNAYGLRLT